MREPWDALCLCIPWLQWLLRQRRTLSGLLEGPPPSSWPQLSNQKAYEELKAAKEAEIAAGQSQIDTKTQELADTDEKNAQAKEDVEDTKKS